MLSRIGCDTGGPEYPRQRRATAEVEAYRKAPGVVAEEQQGEVAIYADPFDWWKGKSTDCPLLSTLARRLLTSPATQAQ